MSVYRTIGPTLVLLLPESLWFKSGKNKIKSQETPSNWTF